jgi:hypothetical protein
MRRVIGRLSLSSTVLLAACDCGGASPSAPASVVSCSTADPVFGEPRTLGAATLTLDDRRLLVTGLPDTTRWVIGRGPALATDPFTPVLDAIEALDPHGVLVLGGFGTGPRLEELVTSLAELTVPALLVPGPRDRLEDLEAALAAHPAPNVVSLAGVHVVEIGSVELLVASGTVDARYVLEGACHLEDLDDVIDEGSRERLRVLVGFDAPAGTPLTQGLDGAEAGSEIVRAAMDDGEVHAGLFAGPDVRVGIWLPASVPASAPASAPAPATGPGPDLRVIVPALVGPALEGADGSRAPSGPFLVALGPAGLGPVTVP